MSKQAGSGKSASQKSVPQKSEAAPAATDPRDLIIDALMDLSASHPWQDFGLAEIAKAANLSLVDVRAAYPSKGAILGAFSRRIDLIVLAGASDDLKDEPARERLFDVLMRRLDAMAPYKTALKHIKTALVRDPLSLAAMNGVALNAHRFMLADAGISSEGALGALKLQGLVIAFSRVLDTWFEDHDESLARTMAHLDRELSRGDMLLGRAQSVHKMTTKLQTFCSGLRSPKAKRTEKSADGDDGYAAAI